MLIWYFEVAQCLIDVCFPPPTPELQGLVVVPKKCMWQQVTFHA